MSITKKQELSNVPISKLMPYAKNPRKNDAAVQRVAKSLEEFGLVKNSIVVDEDMVLITGHTTTKAMQALGWKNAPEVTQVFGLTTSQKQAYRIADNKLGELAEWDTELLGMELEELRGLDFDIELTGFDEEEFNDMLEELHKGDEVQDAEPQVNRAGELQKEWHTELGQMWQCGEHRIICGDCTDNVVVERLMQGEKADMVSTDPPYGMDAVKNSGVLKSKYKNIVGDSNTDAASKAVKIWHAELMVWWGANYYADCLVCTPCWLVWDKNNGQSDQMDAELAWTNFKGVTRIFKQASEKTNRTHPTQKPVELVQWYIKRWGDNVVIVADPFLGSGTTMIACENLGRKCRGCEIDPGYVAVILQRYKDTFPDKEIKLL